MEFVLFLLCFFASANAQIASSSLFSDTKALNPAVISTRRSHLITASVKDEITKKEQALSTEKGDVVNATATVDIDVKTLSFFRGGQGPGYTLELGADLVTGSKSDKASSASESPTASNTATSYVAYAGLGVFEYLGFSVSRVGLFANTKVNGGFEGQTTPYEVKIDIGASAYKAGGRLALGWLAIAGFFEYQDVNTSATIIPNGVFLGSPPYKAHNFVGVGIGNTSKNFHVEAGYEAELNTPPPADTTKKQLNPARITGVIEADFGAVTVGYIGKYYIDGFIDVDRLIYSNFVYLNSFEEPRLDNAVSFSFGKDKGNKFSASIYYTTFTSKEVNTFLQSGNKVITKNTSAGAELKYTYVF